MKMIGNINNTERIFRGKRIDNNQWIYGAYFTMYYNDNREHIHHFIIPNDTNILLGTPIKKYKLKLYQKL